MAEDSDLERTEPASSRRLEKAREEGQVPQSRELMSFLVLLAGAMSFWTLGDWLSLHAIKIVRVGLSFGRDASFDPGAMGNSFLTLSWEGLILAAPLFLLCIVAAIATPFLIGGWVFAPTRLSFDPTHLDPLKGFSRMFSMQGVGEMVKAILKSLLVGLLSYWIVMHKHEELFALLAQPLESGLTSFVRLLMFATLALVVGIGLIAALDVPFQLWQYYSKLRMTKEELRQENKESEGDPYLKAHIRATQREMARKRMMSEVPKADVVVTNPTHFAVALKYDSKTMGAPQVVAKGMNMVAQKIRELAAEHNVPLLEAPPLARALHRHTEIGDPIPDRLYIAVAEVMAYVYQLNQFIASGGKDVLPPQTPSKLAVPEDMDPGAIEEPGQDANA